MLRARPLLLEVTHPIWMSAFQTGKGRATPPQMVLANISKGRVEYTLG